MTAINSGGSIFVDDWRSTKSPSHNPEAKLPAVEAVREKPDVIRFFKKMYNSRIAGALAGIVHTVSAIGEDHSVESNRKLVKICRKQMMHLGNALAYDKKISRFDVPSVPEIHAGAFTDAHNKIQAALREMNLELKGHRGTLSAKEVAGVKGGIANIGSWFKHTHELSSSLHVLEAKMVKAAWALGDNKANWIEKQVLKAQLKLLDLEHNFKDRLFAKHLSRVPSFDQKSEIAESLWHQPKELGIQMKQSLKYLAKTNSSMASQAGEKPLMFSKDAV